jgi:hypothetical protein
MIATIWPTRQAKSKKSWAKGLSSNHNLPQHKSANGSRTKNGHTTYLITKSFRAIPKVRVSTRHELLNLLYATIVALRHRGKAVVK